MASALRGLLRDLTGHGIEVVLVGNDGLRLRARAPVHPSTIACVKANKAELLQHLSDDALRSAWPTLPLKTRIPSGLRVVLAWLACEFSVLTQDERDEILERSAILEFDGESPRWLADLHAAEAVVADRNPDTLSRLAAAA